MKTTSAFIDFILVNLLREMTGDHAKEVGANWPDGFSFSVMAVDMPKTAKFRRELKTRIAPYLKGTKFDAFTKLEFTDNTVRLRTDSSAPRSLL